MPRHELLPVYSVTARRALVADMFDLGLAPMDMTEHLKRELGRAVTVSTVYNDIAFLRKEGRITGRIRRSSGRGRVGRTGAGRGLS